jgi:copper(I)-binding protein
MERVKKIIFISVVLILGNSQVLRTESYFLNKLEISNIWARATPGRTKTAAVYITKIHNAGEGIDSLINIRSHLASKSSIHKTVVDAGIAKMRQVNALEIPAGHSVSLKPGGLHIMMVGMKKSLKEGDNFPLILEFKKSGKIEVVVTVEKIGSTKMIKMDHKIKHQH